MLVQVETRAALAQIEAIASVDGVDGVFIGPSDLAASFGHIGNPAHPEVQAALEDAVKRLKAVGKPAGILTPNEEEAKRFIQWGYTFVAVGADIGLLGAERRRAGEAVQDLDLRHLRIIERPQRHLRRIELSGDVDLPAGVLHIRRIDRLAGLDHGKADGAAERVAVGAGAHIADRLAVPAHDLGMEQHRLRVLHQHLRQPPRQRAGRLLLAAPRRGR